MWYRGSREHDASDQGRDYRRTTAGLQLAAGFARRGGTVQGAEKASIGASARRRADRASGLREGRPGWPRQRQQSQRLFEQNRDRRRRRDRDRGSRDRNSTFEPQLVPKGQTRL